MWRVVLHCFTRYGSVPRPMKCRHGVVWWSIPASQPSPAHLVQQHVCSEVTPSLLLCCVCAVLQVPCVDRTRCIVSQVHQQQDGQAWWGGDMCVWMPAVSRVRDVGSLDPREVW